MADLQSAEDSNQFTPLNQSIGLPLGPTSSATVQIVLTLSFILFVFFFFFASADPEACEDLIAVLSDKISLRSNDQLLYKVDRRRWRWQDHEPRTNIIQ